MITFNITVHRPTVTVAGSGTLSSGITALTGSSGSGKSTIIKSLAGLVKPDEGFIKRDDMVWFDSTKKQFLWPLRTPRRLYAAREHHLPADVGIQEHYL